MFVDRPCFFPVLSLQNKKHIWPTGKIIMYTNYKTPIIFMYNIYNIYIYNLRYKINYIEVNRLHKNSWMPAMVVFSFFFYFKIFQNFGIKKKLKT
jgi:hypothetical protein